jgi:hypothetical protein
MALQKATLVGGEVIYAHWPSTCRGDHCTVHNPSEHHMRDWPQHWRDDRGMMERICPHGIGHPDPDDILENTIHGCDWCCSPPVR